MNIVIGLFTPEQLGPAIKQLTGSGISRDDLSTVANATNIPDYLTGEPEEAAASGAEIGAVAGGALGALGTVALSSIPGMQATAVSGLMATAAGSVLGGFLGSLYGTRAEMQEGMDIEEALAAGDVLLIVRTTAEGPDQVIAIMESAGGRGVEAQEVPEEAAE